MPDRPLSDLESVILGCVAVSGPATAYAVRRMFLDSPSARFSGSAGAIYPALRRLEQRRLVRSAATPTGARPARAYSITPAGRRELRAWLQTPLTPEAGFADDPLRTRMLFLSALSPAARRTWLDEAEACIRAQTGLVDDHDAAHSDDPWMTLAHDNTRRLNRARLRWIAEARKL
ncbi:MAG: PadR family transcriptional regulator, partial [Phycisphaerae bacterium]|nr:PadR family transcriptional regulator [Phycisphaerae bacterium]